MDFSTRGSQQSPAAPRPSSSFQAESSPSKTGGAKHGSHHDSKLAMAGKIGLLVAVTVLLLAVLAAVLLPGAKTEKSYVDNSKLQAVFLTNDQVYFGNINQLNSQYLVLSNIYYLRTQDGSASNASTSGNNVSLVKLGCELHKPYDKMVINRDQVQFWENLQSDGQVAQAVASYAKTNANNTCSNTTSGSTPSSSVQGSTTPTTNTTTGTNSPTNATTTKP